MPSVAHSYMTEAMHRQDNLSPVEKSGVIQQRCQTTDDEPRWLVAFISDTGMRLLSEAAGLAREDIVLDADIPHVIIRPHPWSVIEDQRQ